MLRAALLALFLAWAHAAHATGKRGSFSLRVESRDRAGARARTRAAAWRRSLSEGRRNTTMPLHGAVKDFGYFYANMYLGTPPRQFAVIVDTGSTMTYVPCASCGTACGPNHQGQPFDPAASSTAALIGCGSPKCSCGSPRCGCAGGQCTYSRSYAEQSSSSGVLVEDVASLHDGGPGAPLIFGCETRETGEIFKQRADGLVGLGNSEASVVNQLVKAGLIDDVFSLCFGMVEGDGAMLLGDAPLPGEVAGALAYTPLVASPSHPFYYNARLTGLAVGGQRLGVDASLFDQGYGTVLDSGTTFTYIPSAAFRLFAAAVERHAVARGLRRVDGPETEFNDVCFGGAPADHTDVEGLASVFPSMGLAFDGGAALELGPLNYLFVHTFGSGKYCLGVFDNGRTGTLLGGITFRNVLVRYDRANRRVGFAPAACKALGQAQRPPCSAFAGAGGLGGGAAAALQAAAAGDCEPEVQRQQQAERGEDGAGQQQQQQQQQEGGQGQQREGGGSSPAGGEAATAPPRSGSTGERGSDGSSQGGGGSSSATPLTLVAAGVAVGLVAVAAAGLAAAAALSPGVRERLRGLLPGQRYRTLSEPEAGPADPESAGLVGGATGSGSGGGGGAAGGPAPSKMVPLADFAAEGERRSPPRLTTPQKLQRSVSASASAVEEGVALVVRTASGVGAAGGGMATPPRQVLGTPRSPSPRSG
eukprot:scaffold1.g5894.t1